MRDEKSEAIPMPEIKPRQTSFIALVVVTIIQSESVDLLI